MKRSIKSSCLAALVLFSSQMLTTYPVLAKVNTAGLEAPINGKLTTDAESDSSLEYPSDSIMNSAQNPAQNSITSATNSSTNNSPIESPIASAINPPINPLAVEAQVPWLLPMNGPVAKAGQAITGTADGVSTSGRTKQYSGAISESDSPTLISQRIDQLLDFALNQDDKAQSINKAVAHFNSNSEKIVALSKDASDYLIPYRGFGPSSEAGDIILDEKVKLKSKAAAEYARQEQVDEKHVKIVTYMSQIAMGLGMKDKVRSKQVVASGKQSLAELVGLEEAEKTTTILAGWATSLNIPDQVYKQDVWDVAEREDKLKTVIDSALNSDPVVQEVKRRLHKYNHRSKLANASAHVVETTLGVASMTPTFVGPAAKSALLAFVMATGGPESCKLMKELYLDKRYESRSKVVDAEAHLALDNYHVALLTRNPTLLAFSESLVGEMAGGDKVTRILGTSVLSWAPQASPGATSHDAPALAESANIGL